MNGSTLNMETEQLRQGIRKKKRSFLVIHNREQEPLPKLARLVDANGDAKPCAYALSGNKETRNGRASRKAKKILCGRPSIEHFGFPVNGFHPQFSTDVLPTASLTSSDPVSTELRVENRQNAKINDLVNDIRFEEQRKSIKRQNELEACDASLLANRQRLTRLDDENSAQETEDSSPEYSELHSDVFATSTVAQLIATSGGRIIECK